MDGPGSQPVGPPFVLDLRGADGTADLVRSAAAVVADTRGQTGSRGAQASLPRVLSDVPVAILLINQDTGLITYANRAAVELAPSLTMPVSIDAWAAEAHLIGLGGQPLGVDENPLSAVAQGLPVAGEALRRDDPTSVDPPGLLWATGFPLSRPENPERLSLVILLEITPPTGEEDPAVALQALRDRAIVATDLGFTISDPRETDNPLVWANPSFYSMTGYLPEEVIGRNCRFLQGPATSREEIASLRSALAAERSATVVILNYRKDGTAFWNQLSITPVFDGDGNLVSFVGVQADVTERVEADRDLAAAHAAERRARSEADAARQRILLLAEATTLLSATLDVEESLDRLVSLVVPLLSDWAVVSVVEPDNSIRVRAMKHRDGNKTRLLEEYASLLKPGLHDGSLQRSVQLSGEAVLMERFPEDYAQRPRMDDAVIAVAKRLGMHSGMVVPLIARRKVLGTLALLSGASERVFTRDDLETATDLGRRAGLALDNARLYQREHRVAEQLQRNMLPTLPEVPGLHLAAAYLAGDDAADVGGDFYEVLSLAHGTVSVAIGDVVGHDITAAVRMGQLRSHLRGTAWESSTAGNDDPSVVLERLDSLIQGLSVLPLASACYLRLQRPTITEPSWMVDYSNAGHPHVLLRRPDGAIEVLDQADGIVLGVSLDHQRTSARTRAMPGSQLILYTDGLVERRGSDLEEGHRALLATLLRVAKDASAEAICEALVNHAGDERDDDVAILIVALDAA